MFLEKLRAPGDLNHGRTSRSAYERALVQNEPLFVNNIEAARWVPLVQPENTTFRSQTEDLFLLKELTVQEFKIDNKRVPPTGTQVGSSGAVCKRTPAILRFRRTTSPQSYVVDQRDLRIEFAH
ncbi:ATP-binding cassette (ABC) Superfamily [Phytophthora palmivora]|uniref:ATP-binding cassette (ABC) Superfamily n=1 Tax=Phytophthora palmivora TaxID=4796 RepID=A0A2P4Y5P2_9STRA|nr:ATP-binding cassette (ABC) Superfamily [Phytophthora palmivora]